MSDEEHVDIDESDDEEDLLNVDLSTNTCNVPAQFLTQAEKRAHHNALERKRRDHIKDSFHGLRDSVPNATGEKSSRAQILKQASEYIQFMSKKGTAHLKDIENLKKQNLQLEQQIRALEKAKSTGAYAVQNVSIDDSPGKVSSGYQDSSEQDSSDSDSLNEPRTKKLCV